MSAVVWEMADKNPTPGKKGSKALRWTIAIAVVLVVLGVLLVQMRALASEALEPYAVALKNGEHIDSDIASLAGEAEEIRKVIEAECFGPQMEQSAGLSDGSLTDGAAFDAVNSRCQEIGTEFAPFVDKVEAHTDLFTGLGNMFGDLVSNVTGNVTDKTVEQVKQGDIEQPVRDLYAAVENGEVQ